MFKKILVANRGEIATRVVRTCREMGIATIALYEAEDIGSLHVRLADTAVIVPAGGFMDPNLILQIAREKGADAIHPGYGFLAERPTFIRGCEQAGITFIGPPAHVAETIHDKLATLERARAAGIPTVDHSPMAFDVDEFDSIVAAANSLDYPLVIKSCRGGRGRGERLVLSADRLEQALRRSQTEARAVFGNQRVYMERAILPAHQVGVQIMGDMHGNIIHLGEREGSLIYSNQKVMEESPAPCLTPAARTVLWETALKLAELFNYENIGTIEFLIDEAGNAFFTEIKARIQVEHPLTEMRTGIDLVQAQIRLAAGEPLWLTQYGVRLDGWAMMCRVTAENPFRGFLPSPGQIEQMRLPGGPGVRVDAYVYGGAQVPAQYDPLLAKLMVWAPERETCRERLQRALEDFRLTGIPTNLPLLQRMVQVPAFVNGRYTTSVTPHNLIDQVPETDEDHLRDLAIAAALCYVQRNQVGVSSNHPRQQSGWHRSSRRLPQ